MPVTVPRDRIHWAPTIDPDACIGDRTCVEFCKNDVYAWDEENQRPVVQNPNNCVLGCTTCAQLCPVEAISFPSKEELRETLRRLRDEVQAGAQASILSD